MFLDIREDVGVGRSRGSREAGKSGSREVGKSGSREVGKLRSREVGKLKSEKTEEYFALLLTCCFKALAGAI